MTSRIAAELIQDLESAEAKAGDALSRYKFMMFGYWAAIWVHQNHVGKFRRPNPWKALVTFARERRPSSAATPTPLFEDEAA